MQTVSSISSNFFKKAMLLYASTSINLSPISTTISPKKLTIAQYVTQKRAFAPTRIMGLAHDPFSVPGKSPQEIPTVPPPHNPAVPPEMPSGPDVVPDFDPIPPERPADPPPLPPGPNPGPEIPGPLDPIPKPEAPRPPGEPEIIPPHGPDVIPPKPPEPGPPFPRQPDIPPLIMMGSDGLLFY